MNNAYHNLNAPMPSMTVTASYSDFANEKLAVVEEYGHPVVLHGVNTAIAKSLADTLGKKLISDPIDSLHDTFRKRYYDEPRWKTNFDKVVGSDPMLTDIHTKNPEVLPNAFETIKRFSPSLAKDQLATRSLLRHVAMSGGEMDFATMNLLAETEKFHKESKR